MFASSVNVPLAIDISDGGEDGRMQWAEGPERTDWVPRRHTLFQCKAKDMSAAKCASELRQKNATDLKSRVREAVDANGAYILFYSRACNPEHAAPWIAAMRRTIQESGHPNANTIEIDVYDTSRIAEWANRFPSAVVRIGEWTGRASLHGIISFAEWEAYPENEIAFESDQALETRLSQLRSSLRPERSVARLIGPAGIGKSRFALEALRCRSDDAGAFVQALRDQVVYVDATDQGHVLPSLAIGLRREGAIALLVVDNCVPGLHRQLAREIKHAQSRLSLLTVDSEVPEVLPPGWIRLEPLNDRLMERIVKKAHGGLNDSSIARIVTFAQGFPQIAALLVQSRRHGEPDLVVHDDELMNRLIAGREPPDPVATRTLEACALFKFFGLSDEFEGEWEVIAEHVAQVPQAEFYSAIQRFRRRGIIDVRGPFARVTPRPLALHLAARRWRETPQAKAEALFSGAVPSELRARLAAQFAYLHFLEDAREHVARLCAPTGALGSKEVACTAEGLALLCFLAEVSPSEVAALMERVFPVDDPAAVGRLGAGRIHLVYLAIRLAFWAETFHVGARLAFMAAAFAPPDKISPTAEKAFTMLFQRSASGTQATLLDRLGVLDEALRASHHCGRELALDALAAGLETSQWSRPFGGDMQGSRSRLPEYAPSGDESNAYMRECLSRVLAAAGDDDLKHRAILVLSQKLLGIMQFLPAEATDVVLQLAPTADANTKRVLLSLIRLALSGPARFPLDADDRVKLEAICADIYPSALSDRIELLVAVPQPLPSRSETVARFVETADGDREALAEAFALAPEAWAGGLGMLLAGYPPHGRAFGRLVAGWLQDPMAFLRESLRAAAEIYRAGGVESQHISFTFLDGVFEELRKCRPETLREVLDACFEDPILAPMSVFVARHFGPDRLAESDLQTLLRMTREGALPIGELGALRHGVGFLSLGPARLIWLCGELVEIGENGVCTTLELLRAFTAKKGENWESCEPTIRAILLKSGFPGGAVEYVCLHAWQHLAEFLLDTELSDVEVETLCRSVLVLASSDNRETAHPLRRVVRALLARHPRISWSILASAFGEGDETTRHGIAKVLGMGWSQGDQKPPMFDLPAEELWIWAERYPNAVPRFLAESADLFADLGKSELVNPLLGELIVRFGSREDVRTMIGDRILEHNPQGMFERSALRDRRELIQFLAIFTTSGASEARSWAADIVRRLEASIRAEFRSIELQGLRN